jgi:sugar phosphate permease
MPKYRIGATTISLSLLCVMYGLTYIDRVSFSTAASVMQPDLHFTNMQVGMVFSAFAYPYLFFQIFGGWFSDQFGARKTLAISAIIWSAATIICGLVGGLTGLLVARTLLGFGQGSAFPAATRAMADWTPAAKHGMAQGFMHSSARLGNALTPPLVVWLISWTSWRESFIILGAVTVLWAIAWAIYFRDDPRRHPSVTLFELRSLPDYGSRRQARRRVPWASLTRRMIPVTIVYFCYGWTLWLYVAWTPSYFLHKFQLDLGKSAVFSAGVFLGGVLGAALGGIVSDWLLRKTANINIARRDVVVAGFLLSLTCMVLPMVWRGQTTAAFCFSAALFFAEFTVGPMWAIPMDIAPQCSGSASGLMNVGSALAAILSPLAFGYLVDGTGNWDLPFFGSIGLLFVGAIVAAVWMKPGAPLESSGQGSGRPLQVDA